MATKLETPLEPITAVDPATVEDLIEQRKIGERIKRLRLRKSMGLVELGEKTGLSASFLSQLETGRVVPTIRNLARIAMVFSKDLAYFFHAEKEALFRVSKKRDRVRLPQGEGSNITHIAESFGILVPDNAMRPCIAEFLPVSQNQGFRPSVFPRDSKLSWPSPVLLLSSSAIAMRCSRPVTRSISMQERRGSTRQREANPARLWSSACRARTPCQIFPVQPIGAPQQME